MKQQALFFCLAILAGCASQSPQTIIPPPMTQSEFAQITVKREFRLVGGGNTDYIYDLFDSGDSIEYDVDVADINRPFSPHLVRIGEIGPDLFDNIVSTRATIEVVGGVVKAFERIDPWAQHEKLVERFDSSLLGSPLFALIDSNGGPRINPTASLSLARDGIQRIKFRQLYDIRERTLYRVIERAVEPCLVEIRNISLTGEDLTELDVARFLTAQDSMKIQEAQVAIQPAVRDRPDDFLYGETCGLHISRDPKWNARYVGALKGFDQGTWYRPPGRMALSAKFRALSVSADEVEVEAGRQYVGLYDPYSNTLVLEAVEQTPP